MVPPLSISVISSSTKRKQSKKYKLKLFALQDLFHIYIFPLENNIDGIKFVERSGAGGDMNIINVSAT